MKPIALPIDAGDLPAEILNVIAKERGWANAIATDAEVAIALDALLVATSAIIAASADPKARDPLADKFGSTLRDLLHAMHPAAERGSPGGPKFH